MFIALFSVITSMSSDLMVHQSSLQCVFSTTLQRETKRERGCNKEKKHKTKPMAILLQHRMNIQ